MADVKSPRPRPERPDGGPGGGRRPRPSAKAPAGKPAPEEPASAEGNKGRAAPSRGTPPRARAPGSGPKAPEAGTFVEGEKPAKAPPAKRPAVVASPRSAPGVAGGVLGEALEPVPGPDARSPDPGSAAREAAQRAARALAESGLLGLDPPEEEAGRDIADPSVSGREGASSAGREGPLRGLPPPSKDMSRAELAEQYGPYVRAIAGKVKKTLSKDIEFDDLLGYGMLGLMEAADRFDARYGANFMTFAYYRVRGAIYDGLRGMGWVSRTEYQKYRFEQHANEYLRTVTEQEAVGGGVRKTDDDEVSEIADAVEGLITIYVTALDAMEGFQVADDAATPIDESIELSQARRLVSEAVEKLPEQERTLLTLYYYQELSLEEVGKHLGLSKSWTSRLHTRAIEKLGRLLRDLVEEYGQERPLLPKKKPGGRKPAQPAR